MIGVIAGMIATACFFFAAEGHRRRGELEHARRCIVMTILSFALFLVAVGAAI